MLSVPCPLRDTEEGREGNPCPACGEQHKLPLEDRYRKRARELYAKGSDDNVEIDDDAKVSVSDSGAFVQAWVWVPAETEED